MFKSGNSSNLGNSNNPNNSQSSIDNKKQALEKDAGSSLDLLPSDLINFIFSILSPRDCLTLGMCCKLLNQALNHYIKTFKGTYSPSEILSGFLGPFSKKFFIENPSALSVGKFIETLAFANLNIACTLVQGFQKFSKVAAAREKFNQLSFSKTSNPAPSHSMLGQILAADTSKQDQTISKLLSVEKSEVIVCAALITNDITKINIEQLEQATRIVCSQLKDQKIKDLITNQLKVCQAINSVSTQLSNRLENVSVTKKLSVPVRIDLIFEEYVGKSYINLSGVVLPTLSLKIGDLLVEYSYYNNFSGVNLQSANLKSSSWQGINFSGVNLQDANLEFSIWSGRFFSDGANLIGMNFTGANLVSSFLYKAKLLKANLAGVNLKKAHLNFANLEEANLEGANLEDANLEEANLNYANLEGVIVSEATNFNGCTFLSATLLLNTLELRSWLDKLMKSRESLLDGKEYKMKIDVYRKPLLENIVRIVNKMVDDNNTKNKESLDFNTLISNLNFLKKHVIFSEHRRTAFGIFGTLIPTETVKVIETLIKKVEDIKESRSQVASRVMSN